jgi:hypothetical protein
MIFSNYSFSSYWITYSMIFPRKNPSCILLLLVLMFDFSNYFSGSSDYNFPPRKKPFVGDYFSGDDCLFGDSSDYYYGYYCNPRERRAPAKVRFFVFFFGSSTSFSSTYSDISQL